jgi:hypothetical protein
MLRRTMTLVVLVVVSTLLLPETAFAFGYKDTGFDEREGKGVNLDIRSTTRKVWASADGRRWLNVRIRSYDPLGDDWFAGVKIDSRGGPLKDYRLFVYWHFESGFCGVQQRGSIDWTEGTLINGDQPEDTWAICRVPLHLVRPNKQIRWKVWGINDRNRIDEYAPSGRGWYS